MKQLLIEEMKRAIYLMETNEHLKKMKEVHVDRGQYRYYVVDREISELKQLLLAIRKHSIMLEKGIE
jgi:phosphoenolpyruvate synthase/pyruvate phosphate dikinase